MQSYEHSIETYSAWRLAVLYFVNCTCLLQQQKNHHPWTINLSNDPEGSFLLLSFSRECQPTDSHSKTWCFPLTPSWHIGHGVPGHWSTEHNPTKPPSALSQSTWLRDSLRGALMSCQSCLHWTNTPTHKFRKDVQPHSHFSCVSTLWGIMRKIKYITSITPLTHFSRALSNTAPKPFSGLLRYPSASQDTQLSFKFRFT